MGRGDASVPSEGAPAASKSERESTLPRPRVDLQPILVPKERSAAWLEWTKALATPLASFLVAVIGGYYLTGLIKDKESRDTNERLYTQLLIQREQSDANIRKDMFSVVIKQFLAESPGQDWNDRILQLELLAHNFNQSLDLAPLFKEIARRLPDAPDLAPQRTAHLLERLDRTAAALNFRQVNSLARRGYERQLVFDVGRWQSRKDKTLIRATVPKLALVPSTSAAPVSEKDQIDLSVEIVGADLDRREIEVRLRVHFSDNLEHRVDRHFRVGRYDFPMLDNTQLANGLRAAVVVTHFDVPAEHSEREANSFATVHLVVFPAASASFKERHDYDDVLLDMTRNQQVKPAAERKPP